MIRSNIDLGSSMKVGSTTLLKSAPGRSWEIMWDRTVQRIIESAYCPAQRSSWSLLTIALFWLDDGLIFGRRGTSCIPIISGRPAT